MVETAVQRLESLKRVPREEQIARIETARRRLGPELVILVHHYQSDDIMAFADFRGDSLELSRVAAAQRGARYIVFCGVGFMAETAAMLAAPGQHVLLPALDAPCPMALMADADDAQAAWDALAAAWGPDTVVPITYQNSSATVKAFCGRHGGAVCTSANAQAVFRWAFDQGKRILFFPDEWLGTNSALALGLTPAQIAVWEPSLPGGGRPALDGVRIVVWKGFCHVHTRFSVQQVQAARLRYPGATVIVHPECPVDVVQAADQNGSTSFIIRQVEAAPAGAVFVIGTECHMVRRLAREHPDKTVVPLSESSCGTMSRTTLAHLLNTLEGLTRGELVGEVTVPDEIAHWANLALERMLTI
jgi:quinolinate synthase